MRLRLGLLQTPEAIERQHAREAAEAAARKAKADVPTVKTEAQAKADEIAKSKDKDKAGDKAKRAKPHIRPLSEAKAIDSGANFISETFIFSVGLGLILFENWRSRRKEQTRRNDVADKLAELEERDQAKEKALEALEHEVTDLRAKGKPLAWPFSSGASKPTHPSSEEVSRAPSEQPQPTEKQAPQQVAVPRTEESSSLLWPFSALSSLWSNTSSPEHAPREETRPPERSTGNPSDGQAPEHVEEQRPGKILEPQPAVPVSASR